MIRLLDSGLMVSLGTENLAICIKLEDKETIEMQFPRLKRLTIITRQHMRILRLL